MELLHDTADEARKNLGAEALRATAAKGYESRGDIEACLPEGVMPDAGFRYDREEGGIPPDYHRACLHAGSLPDCCQNTNLRVELQFQPVESCFIPHGDGSVTWPMGKPLVFQGNKKNGAVYGSKEACRCCPNRRGDGKAFKTVKFGPNTQYVPARMYGSPRYPLPKIPNVYQPDHYHAYGRVRHAPARVMLFIRRDKGKQREPLQVREHPFGTIKDCGGAGYFLCKGKEKAAAETALMYLSCNIRPAISPAGGVQRLTALLQSRMRSGIPMPI